MKKLSMSAKVFLGFGVGAALGLLFQEKILFVQPVGDLFWLYSQSSGNGIIELVMQNDEWI